jgi:hypothetical protein
MSSQQFSAPPRLFRLGASAVNLLPVLAPGFTLLDYYIDVIRSPHAGNWGRLAIAELLLLASALAGIVMLILNGVGLARRRQSVGLRYFGLAVEGTTSGRLLLAEAAMLVLPPLLGFVLFLALDEAVSDEPRLALALALPAASYAGNWAASLGASRRTLGDRLGGGRVTLLAEPRAATLRASDLLLIALPCVGLPALLIEPVLPISGPAVSLVTALLVAAKRRYEAAHA